MALSGRSAGFRLVARAFELGERWISRRASAIVAIAPSFIPVHEAWGTADRTTVIPNWAPLDEIVPVDRKNDWAVENRLDDTLTLDIFSPIRQDWLNGTDDYFRR